MGLLSFLHKRLICYPGRKCCEPEKPKIKSGWPKGKPRNSLQKLKDGDIKKILDMVYARKESYVTIAKRFNISDARVSQIVKQFKENKLIIPRRSPNLSAQNLEDLKRRYLDGDAIATIMKRYDLSPGTLYSILDKLGVRRRSNNALEYPIEKKEIIYGQDSNDTVQSPN